MGLELADDHHRLRPTAGVRVRARWAVLDRAWARQGGMLVAHQDREHQEGRARRTRTGHRGLPVEHREDRRWEWQSVDLGRAGEWLDRTRLDRTGRRLEWDQARGREWVRDGRRMVDEDHRLARLVRG